METASIKVVILHVNLNVRFHLGSGINGNKITTALGAGAAFLVRFHLGSGINGNYVLLIIRYG